MSGTLLTRNRRASPWIILVTVLVGVFFTAIIPPLQSPDETDHIKRAYLLSVGTILLDAPAGMSGGNVDTGLLAYMDAYSHIARKAHRKLSADEAASAAGIRWTGVREFSPAPGTGYYFPAIYLPQALGLAVGKWVGLTVDRSYQLARLSALASIALLLFAAFSIYAPSPFLIALLIIPMSVFQFASASLDGISTAIAVLAVASYLRLSEDRSNRNRTLFSLLALSVVVLATSRVHLVPLLALLLVACFQMKSPRAFIVFALAVASVAVWLAIAIFTTVDTRVVVGAPTASVAMFYLSNPLRFIEVLAATLSSDLTRFYRHSFIGVLGWLDTPLPERAYEHLSICLALTGVLSLSFRRSSTSRIRTAVLLLSALASVLLIFLALLITWNPHPAEAIQGVQGRYFLIPLIMVAYATSGGLALHEGFFRKLALVPLVLIAAFTVFSTPRILIERYFMALEQPAPAALSMRPSKPLDKSNPAMLHIAKDGDGGPEPLERIGIMFGTYARNNEGSALLTLNAPDGQELTVQIDLSSLADNRYSYFSLNGKPYASGRIVYETGGGVSTWEAHGPDGSVATCLVREYMNGRKTITRGCPRP